jgi:GTPase SAR1 family protein|tara:strand:+ start:531 stop:2432 length:1902 start_codon:yes stop_codon:yes gene_type:complete
MSFNPHDYLNLKTNRYQKYLDSLKIEKFETKQIEETVKESIDNIKKKKSRSFVIYGEPQSGKTSMMIALTGKLLDEGHKFIIILVQDNLFLESQNYIRFHESTLSPSPKKFSDILHPDVKLKDREFIIFCKKNSSNLRSLLKKVDNIKQKVVIDDEADFASPNAKINKRDETTGEESKTKINERITNLLGSDGIYIGVTATPARLDLNNTFLNENQHWVFFKPHYLYRGQDIFFPLKRPPGQLKYTLKKLPNDSQSPLDELRTAIYRYLVNSAFVNLYVNKKPKNYIMLIHTSGKMADHTKDRMITEEIFRDLATKSNNGKGNEKYIKILKEIHKIALKKTQNEDKAREITKFIGAQGDQNQIGVLNSDKENKKGFDLKMYSESPSSLYTLAIGGNIISRGITFKNLLSMFFTRTVRSLMQQDTYIQRARMFGSRQDSDLEHFELTIPSALYDEWYTCFALHRLSYISATHNIHQVWLEGMGTKAVASGSIDKSNVRIDKGEMSFDKVKYSKRMDDLINSGKESKSPTKILNLLVKSFGDTFLPKHILDFLENLSSNPDEDIALHNTNFIENWTDGDSENISRARGIFGKRDYDKFPIARHHFILIRNKKDSARIFYNFIAGKVGYLKNVRSS